MSVTDKPKDSSEVATGTAVDGGNQQSDQDVDRVLLGPDDDRGLSEPDSEASESGREDSEPEPGGGTDNAGLAPSGLAESSTRPRGRLMGFLGLLMGLAGLAGAGYLYYLLVFQNPQAAVDARFASVEQLVQERGRELREIRDQQQSALNTFAEEQRRERDASAEGLLDAVNQLATQAPPSRREWKIAEVAYLLRIANHRLLMERDADGAMQLLIAADDIVQELDDFVLYQVRAQLADEILALRNVESNDVQGMFLRLEAVKSELSAQALQLKLPRLADAEPPASEESPGFIAALSEEFGSYLRFRRFDDASLKPLLAPEEATYLELNLRLMLERAQLAALRREQIIFEHSLSTAIEWMEAYLDVENQGIKHAIEELNSLSAIELEQPLPDISGSLSTLNSLEES